MRPLFSTFNYYKVYIDKILECNKISLKNLFVHLKCNHGKKYFFSEIN